MRLPSLLALLAATVALALPASAPAATLPPIHHVFVIALENQGYAATFGNPAADPYLARTLVRRGALLTNYYATGHESNDNYVSLVSGQPPNVENQADCQIFDNFAGVVAPDGVAIGAGCVYPASVANIGTQLSGRGLNWKAYQEDMGNDPTRESAACGHPALNSRDNTQSAQPGDGYATRHNPFVYFHNVIDSAAYCDAHVVALGSPTGAMPASALPGETGLATDLKSESTIPALSFITPNLCDDGHDYPCVNQPSGPSALADIDRFLETWVPLITSSPGWKTSLLEITFDEASNSDSSACCGETPQPGGPAPGITGPGGGRVGAVLISPFITPGTITSTAYNHYSALASWEDLFALPRLADAATVASSFGSHVYTAWH